MSTLSTDQLPARPARKRLLLAPPKEYIISPLPVSQVPLSLDTVIEIRLYAAGLKGQSAILTLADTAFYNPAIIPHVEPPFTLGDDGWVTKSFTLTGQERYALLTGVPRYLVVGLSSGNLSTWSEPFSLATVTDCDCGESLEIFLTDIRGSGPGPRFGGTHFADEFVGWKDLIQDGRATPDERIIITGVSLGEGKLDAIQGLDNQILSVGIMQKTLSPKLSDGGQLAKQLYEFQQANPARYACLLGNCGWQVQRTGGNYQASYTKPGTTDNYTSQRLRTLIREPHKDKPKPPIKNEPLAPFVRLLQDKVFQEKQVLDFLKMLKDLLDEKPVDAHNSSKKQYTYKAGLYLSGSLGNLGRALLLDHKVNRDSQPMSYFGKALTTLYAYPLSYWQGLGASSKPADDPGSWSNADRFIYEKELIKIYGPLRATKIAAAESGAGLAFKPMSDAPARFNRIRCYFSYEQHVKLDWLPIMPVKIDGKLVVPECKGVR